MNIHANITNTTNSTNTTNATNDTNTFTNATNTTHATNLYYYEYYYGYNHEYYHHYYFDDYDYDDYYYHYTTTTSTTTIRGWGCIQGSENNNPSKEQSMAEARAITRCIAKTQHPQNTLGGPQIPKDVLLDDKLDFPKNHIHKQFVNQNVDHQKNHSECAYCQKLNQVLRVKDVKNWIHGQLLVNIFRPCTPFLLLIDVGTAL